MKSALKMRLSLFAKLEGTDTRIKKKHFLKSFKKISIRYCGKF